jgi:hypothetical protein
MKILFFLPLFLLTRINSTNDSPFIDPTGTYMLKGEVKNNVIVGYSGELRILLLNQHTVAMCLYLNKGYPGYESGALLDTLDYENNKAVYIPTNDSSCSVYFSFDKKTVEIFKFLTDPHSGCGFRPGVLVPSLFQKTSSEIPVIQDLSAQGIP